MDDNLVKREFKTVSEVKLRRIVEEIFRKMKVSDQDSKLAADVLVAADIRGVESHGVSNMLRKYIRDFKTGKLNPNPTIHILRESLSTASIDSDSGLGIIVAPKAMEMAIEKAKKTGMGMITIKNSGHMGMVSYYPMQALKHDMIGLAMTSTKPVLVPTFGAVPKLGTNPISLAAPALKEAPFVYDASTTVISSNKLTLFKRLGMKLPSGLIADKEGQPILKETDLNFFDEENLSHPRLLPLGGTPEGSSHKGYGLAGIVEILGGILAGAGYSIMANRNGYSHCVMAIDIGSFMDPDEFKKTMDEWIRDLKSTPPSPGNQRVLYPGQKEAECEAKYKVEGIPLHKEVILWFNKICEELSIVESLE